MKKILILNGPNLNLLGRREPEIYGSESFDEYVVRLGKRFAERGVVFEYRQSNLEGQLIDWLHEADGHFDGVVMNAGGYTHTSVAIADAVRAVGIPVVEVHISNIFAREEYRHVSITGAACRGCITGFGLDSYRLAVEALIELP